MALRMETVNTLAEELFLLQTLGDDRAAVEVYVAGRAAKSGAARAADAMSLVTVRMGGSPGGDAKNRKKAGWAGSLGWTSR